MKHPVSKENISLFDRLFNYLYRLRSSDRFILYILGLIFIGAAIITGYSYNQSKLTTVPERGGVLTEGIVGTPRFINPVLAITRADTDLTSLIYSGLIKLAADGSLQNDLAESVTISDDGLTYNVILKDNIYFHDGNPITTDDIAFTIALIQDPELKSPLRGNWSGVTVEQISDREINFVLDTPYTPFIENLMVGILPKHVWGGLTTEELPFSQTNTEPIGSGPYELTQVKRTKSGLIDSYVLTAFTQSGVTPNITTLNVRFFQNEDALLTAFNDAEITSTASLSSEKLSSINSDTHQIIQAPLPRVFTIFFNQNKSAVVRDKAVREALEVVIDKQALVSTTLKGSAIPTDLPVPAGFSTLKSSSTASSSLDIATRIEEAKEILRDGDWSQNSEGVWQKDIDDVVTPLAITLTTANSDTFVNTAKYLADTWTELGVQVTVEKFEQSDLIQAVIRPRDYQTLLFGTDVGRQLDLYPFWHSSQREDPGLNISAYANITADDQLEILRSTTDANEKHNALKAFSEEINIDKPAIFLYTPTFAFVISKEVMLVPVEKLAKPAERFSTISDWYMNEDSVWPLFKDNN